MVSTHPSGYWSMTLKGVAIVYGISFATGLALAFDDITPQTNPNIYPLLALVTGAIGVAIALRVAHTTRVSYLLGIGIGLWFVSVISVLAGAQSVTSWLASSVSVATTVILGRLLLETGRESPRTLDLTLKGIINDRNSALLERRARKSFL
jgi:hypothetical protein